MTYPNPAGYYLPLPEAIEREITALDRDDLQWFLGDLAAYLNRDDVNFPFESVYGTYSLDAFIEALNASGLIALIRWVAECLSWLESQEKANDAKP